MARQVPATYLKIMRGINLPEFDMDFSLIYNLQYSADTLEVENQFSRLIRRVRRTVAWASLITELMGAGPMLMVHA